MDHYSQKLFTATNGKTFTLNELITLGYRVTSRRWGMVSRIDRADWKNYMAIQHSPWSKDEGLQWVECLGSSAEDHYRRCYSKDALTFEYEARLIVQQIPNSNGEITGYQDSAR